MLCSWLRGLQLILAYAVNRHKLRLEDYPKLAYYNERTYGQLTEHTVSRNGSDAPAAIRPVRLDRELPLLTRAHVQETLVPALDDLSLSDNEAQRLPAIVGCIELSAVLLESTAIVYIDLVTCYTLPVALDCLGDLGLEVLYTTLAVAPHAHRYVAIHHY